MLAIGSNTLGSPCMITIFRHALLLLPSLLSACSDTRGQELRTARSSVATGVMVIDAWLGGAAPDHYARSALDSARATIARTAGELAKEDSPVAENAADILLLDTSRAALRRAATAIAISDRAAVGASRAELDQAASLLRRVVTARPHE
jgi:hypothetical protein